MRLATWNLERARAGSARSVGQLAVMAEIEADMWFLTEAPIALHVSSSPIAVSSDPEPGVTGDVWAAIHGPQSLAPVPDLGTHAMAVAALATISGTDLVVYASVLPWMGASAVLPDEVIDGNRGADLFCHVLDHQVTDLRVLRARYPHRALIWAGDFNQTLAGPNWGGSNRGRQALSRAFADLALVAWTAQQDHDQPGSFAIDHIAGPTRFTAVATTRWGGKTPQRRLSDHAGYAVDLRGLRSITP